MKKNNKIGGLLVAALTMAAVTSSCTDWTQVESLDLQQATVENRNPELYAKYLNALRNYKSSDHTLVYAWFDNAEKKPFNRSHHLTDLPDSIDVVGLMHPDNLSEWELKEMEQVRTLKATKVVYTVDFESIKAAYNKKLELATETEPVTVDFIGFLTDSLQYSLSLAGKYKYDGICVAYAGKARIHMRPAELKSYIENETAFIKIIRDWYKRNPENKLIYEGKPQNLIDTSLLKDCISVLISGKQATDEADLTHDFQLAVQEGVPTDRLGMTVMATDLNDPNKKIGYFTGGVLAMEGLANWATTPHGGVRVKAVGVYNVSTDYYSSTKDYYYVKQLISSVNPSIK